MAYTSIDAKTLQRSFLCGAYNLSNQKEYINELNVFPVPDGDTGTNMTLTIMSAAEEVEKFENPSMDQLAKAISGGSLRGARGNSGVILSQLFRGFCKDIKGKDKLGISDLVSAFNHAVDTAYKAVMKPKEGTILTVARGIAEKADDLCETDLVEFLEQVLTYGEEVLDSTPDLLPVLKEAGVVDSGGKGLIEVLRGILMGIKGQEVVLEDKAEASALQSQHVSYVSGSGNDNISTADIKFGYCTEFIIMLDKELSDEEVMAFKEYLLSIGDSLVCVADEDLVKVHVHTNHPGLAFEKALGYGSLTRMKIDNMREEHSERVLMEQEKARAKEQEEAFKQMKLKKLTPKKAERPKKYGVIAVSVGLGMNQILKDIGVDYIISGGQTMNPSTDDFLSAIDEVNAENIILLPNNKNIILAANQAASVTDDKNVFVIPSTSLPQGISAMVSFAADATPEENIASMNESMQTVKTGEVTYSVRDTFIDGKTIVKGNIMGISDRGIDAVGKDIAEVTKELIASMVDEDAGLISLYYGNDIGMDEAEKLKEELEEVYSDLDVDLHQGGQPIYYYIVSVE